MEWLLIFLLSLGSILAYLYLFGKMKELEIDIKMKSTNCTYCEKAKTIYNEWLSGRLASQEYVKALGSEINGIYEDIKNIRQQITPPPQPFEPKPTLIERVLELEAKKGKKSK